MTCIQKLISVRMTTVRVHRCLLMWHPPDACNKYENLCSPGLPCVTQNHCKSPGAWCKCTNRQRLRLNTPRGVYYKALFHKFRTSLWSKTPFNLSYGCNGGNPFSYIWKGAPWIMDQKLEGILTCIGWDVTLSKVGSLRPLWLRKPRVPPSDLVNALPAGLAGWSPLASLEFRQWKLCRLKLLL
jgi:hypothetical protein